MIQLVTAKPSARRAWSAALLAIALAGPLLLEGAKLVGLSETAAGALSLLALLGYLLLMRRSGALRLAFIALLLGALAAAAIAGGWLASR